MRKKYLSSLMATTLSIAFSGALLADEDCQPSNAISSERVESELVQMRAPNQQPTNPGQYQQAFPSQQAPQQQPSTYYQQQTPSSLNQQLNAPSGQQSHYQQRQYTQQTPQYSNYGQSQIPGQIQWLMNYQQAVGAAKQQSRYILLFFTGSDWCGWCKKMESEVFSDPAFANAVSSKFVFVEVDFPMNKALPSDIAQQNAQLKQQYGITGYPTVVILDSNQNFVAETGYRPGGGREYANYLMGLVQ
jgi:thiol-disulfide isomerase/thioredoxin